MTIDEETRSLIRGAVHGVDAGRSCAGCDLCCTVMEVEELQKPAGTRCAHLGADPGRNCLIYPGRPTSCREFACMWLQGATPEKLKPCDAGYVLVMRPPTVEGRRLITLHADPDRPDAWARPWSLTRLRLLALRFKAAIAINIPPDDKACAIISPVGRIYHKADRPELFAKNQIRIPVEDEP